MKKEIAALAKSNPRLKQAWDEYGMDVKWEDLFGYKMSPTHGYVVLCWKEGDELNMADLSFTGEIWDMQNDGFDCITEADWKKLQMVPDCDWFVIPGHPDYTGC